MSDYQSFYPPPKQQYGGYPIQEQPQRIQSYPPALPSAHFFNPNQEIQFAAEQDIYKQNHYKRTKRVKLLEGNFVIECPVPSKLLSIVPEQDDKEFTHMRYTACTCDPDNFRENKYTLRQVLYEKSRQTELFIAITMYNVSIHNEIQHKCCATVLGTQKMNVCCFSQFFFFLFVYRKMKFFSLVHFIVL
jgi:chitin synthase